MRNKFKVNGIQNITKFIFLTLIINSNLTYGNVVGLDTQSFNPTGDQLGFITVHSGKTIKPGILGVSLFLDYARNSQFVYSLPIEDQKKLNHKDQSMGLQAGLAYGLSPNIQIGVAFPFVLMQKADSNQDRTITVTKGLNSSKYYGKWNFLSSKESGDYSLLTSYNIPNVQNDPLTGHNPPPVTDLEFAWSRATVAKNTFGINGGYRFRKAGSTPSNPALVPVSDQIIYSMAYGTPISDDGKKRFIGEFYGSSLASSRGSNSFYKSPNDIATQEILGAVKTQVGQRQFFTFGATIGLNQPGISADYRLFVGYNFYLDFTKKTSPPKAIEVPETFGSQDANDPISSYNPSEPITPIRPSEYEALQNDKSLIVDITGEMEQDNDQDGVPDAYDKCPDSPLGQIVDRFGCEVKVSPFINPVKPQETFVLEDVLFDFGKFNLAKPAFAVLDKIIKNLKKKKYKAVQIIGHTDSIGSDEFNFILSMKRAKTVRKYFYTHGIDPLKIRIYGRGEKDPIATNKTKAGRQRNRRVVINLFKDEVQ